MFNKSDIQHLDKQYEELAHKLNRLEELMVRRFNYAQDDRTAEREKLEKYFKKYYYFIAGDKMHNELLGFWGDEQDDQQKDSADKPEPLTQLHQVYSLIFKHGDASSNLSDKFNKDDYYRVDVDIEDATESEINAILLKHILNYKNNPQLTYKQIQTVVYEPQVNYYTGDTVVAQAAGEKMKNGFFYEPNVVGYKRTTFTNNDKLISYIKVDNLYNKSREIMKNLTQFEVKND